mmetsp:Transcript_6138/g.10637  ORF Transcript_6138/g.10637 Transcript_6138/m.10637 type:complete len:384 (-) Transcript_6138:122-1273(-)
MTTPVAEGASGSMSSAWEVNAQGLVGDAKHVLVEPHGVVRRQAGNSEVQHVGETAVTDIGEIAHVESVPMGSSMVLPGDARILTEMWEAIWWSKPAGDANKPSPGKADWAPSEGGNTNFIHIEEGIGLHGMKQVPAAAAPAPAAPAGTAPSNGGASMLGIIVGLVLLGLLLAMIAVVAVTWLRYKAQISGGTNWIQDGRASGKYTSLYASRKQMRAANSGTSSSSSVALRANDNRDDAAGADVELLNEQPAEENQLPRGSSASSAPMADASVAEQQAANQSDASNRKSRSSEEPRSRSGSQSPTARRSGSNSQDSGADTKDRLRKARNQALLAARASNASSAQRSGSVRSDRSPSTASARPSTRRSASRGPKPTDAPVEDLTF